MSVCVQLLRALLRRRRRSVASRAAFLMRATAATAALLLALALRLLGRHTSFALRLLLREQGGHGGVSSRK